MSRSPLRLWERDHSWPSMSKRAEIIKKAVFFSLRHQNHRLFGGRRNASYSTRLASSITIDFRTKTAFFKNRHFFGLWSIFSIIKIGEFLHISKLSQYFNSHLQTKIDITSDEDSFESSVFRAFRGALNEGISYFRFQVMAHLLAWNFDFRFWETAQTSEISAIVWSRSQSRRTLRHVSQDSYRVEVWVSAIKRASCPCPA